MVAAAKRAGGAASARSGSSSARGNESRIPSMQLVRVSNAQPSGDKVTATASAGGDGGGGGEGETGNGDVSWMMAVAAPMSVLHGFCLAVIALETGLVGATVSVVDRSAVAAEEEAAEGFLEFDKVCACVCLGVLLRCFESARRGEDNIPCCSCL